MKITNVKETEIVWTSNLTLEVNYKALVEQLNKILEPNTKLKIKVTLELETEEWIKGIQP
jgi:hypothetical protein